MRIHSFNIVVVAACERTYEARNAERYALVSLPRHGFLWADQSVIYQERRAHAVQIGETESTQAAGLVGGHDGAVAHQEALDGETEG